MKGSKSVSETYGDAEEAGKRLRLQSDKAVEVGIGERDSFMARDVLRDPGRYRVGVNGPRRQCQKCKTFARTLVSMTTQIFL